MTIAHKTITIANYSPAWPREFQKLKDMLWRHVSGNAVDIVHFGSTAVPGLAAKSVIDLTIVIHDRADFPALKTSLENLGFIHEGDLSIPGREAFKDGPKEGYMPYHLYVCTHDTPSHLKHLTFRDYLRTHPFAVMAYGNLKRHLAQSCEGDLDAYTSGKTTFIESILTKA